MVITTYEIPYKNGQKFKLRPIFDVHLGNKACDSRKLRKDIDESDEDTYFLLGGDVMDSIIVKDKRYRKSIDDVDGDPIIDRQLARAVEIFEPIKDRIIGIGSGNHEDAIVINSGTDPTQRLCDALGVSNLGYSGIVRLVFFQKGKKGTRGRSRTLMIRWHHGWGGGTRTQGGSITKYSKDVPYWEADLYLYGHDHRLQTDDVPRMVVKGDRLVAHPRRICLCGSYLKSYIIGKPSSVTYSEKFGFPPITVGGLTVQLSPDNPRDCVGMVPILE